MDETNPKRRPKDWIKHRPTHANGEDAVVGLDMHDIHAASDHKISLTAGVRAVCATKTGLEDSRRRSSKIRTEIERRTKQNPARMQKFNLRICAFTF